MVDFRNVTECVILAFPLCLVMLNCEHTTFHIVHVAHVLMQSKRDSGHVVVHFDTLRFCTFLCHDNHLLSRLVNLANCLHAIQLSDAVENPSKDIEEYEQENQTTEHNTHGK